MIVDSTPCTLTVERCLLNVNYIQGYDYIALAFVSVRIDKSRLPINFCNMGLCCCYQSVKKIFLFCCSVECISRASDMRMSAQRNFLYCLVTANIIKSVECS